MHTRDGEIRFSHFLSQPIHLPLRIAKDHRLSNRQRIIQLHNQHLHPVTSKWGGIGKLHHTTYQTSNPPFPQQ